MEEALESLGVESCEEFLHIYFDEKAADNKRFFQPIAYDSGLCVPQDMEVARDLYEAFYREGDFSGVAVARLALIYAYGSDQLRDKARSVFFFKQAAIYVALARNNEERRTALHAMIGIDKPFPKELEQELVWLEQILKESKIDRERIAEELSEQGYRHTEYLAY